MPFDLAPGTTVEVEPPVVPVLTVSPPIASPLQMESLPSSAVLVELPGIPDLIMGSPPSSVVAVLPMSGPPGPAGSVGTHTHNYLDLSGSVPVAALPAVALINFLGTASSQTEMLALSGQRGDWATRTDLNTDWVLIADTPAVIDSWRQVTYPVSSVASKTGAVTLVKGDVGLGNVDNTSDANKPVSTAQAAALVAKATLTAKGDMYVATSSGVVVRLPVNATDGYALLTDSTQTAGVRWGSVASGGVPDASTSVKGIVQLAGDLAGTAASPTVPGLASKVGTSDPRLTDARTPTGTAGGDLAGTYPNPTIKTALNDPVAATPGLRTLGTGAQQACAGADTRLSDSRTPLTHSHPESDITNLVFDLGNLVPTSRSVVVGTGLTGGGTLTVDRTISIAAGGVGSTEIATAIKDPAAATAGLRTLGTGSAQAAAGNHTHPTASIPVVSSTASITSPFTGQVIFNTTDNMLYRYDGSAWVAFLATGGNTAATRHEARYEQTSGQSIANTTDAKVQFPTAVTTSNDVTASGTGNTDFSLSRLGVWLLTASIRYAPATGGERHLSIATGTNVATLTSRVVMQSTFPGSAAGPVAVATVIRITATTSVMAATWQNNGSAVAMETIWGTGIHFSMTWLRPL